jgi:Zn-finger nucleic acid-binding protein
MLHVQLGTAVLLECSDCDSVWIDAADFERVCADREARAAVLHRWTSGRGQPARTVRYRPCVRCGTLMNRVNFGRLSGTVVDVCRGHGTFLDAGELHAIATFIEGGGLDRAREQEIEELREEERRLLALQARTAAGGQDGIHFRTTVWSGRDVAQLLDLLKKR